MKTKRRFTLIEGDRSRGPSERFLKLTRNPDVESPSRFEPTRKASGDVVI